MRRFFKTQKKSDRVSQSGRRFVRHLRLLLRHRSSSAGFLSIGAAFALGFSLTACSTFPQGTGFPVTTECILPDDQSGTIPAKWRTLPIPVALESGSGGFPESELEPLLLAADRWNTHFETVFGVKAIDYGERGAIRTMTGTKPSSTCSQGVVSGTSYIGNINIFLHSTWPYSNMATTIALTTTCASQASPFMTNYAGVMELNYQNYFVSGKPLPDLESIVTHELGHLLGLKHSCKQENRESDPGPFCEAEDTPQSYIEAVLYPSFFFNEFGAGQVRADLNENDQGRANCLYDALREAE